MNPNAQWHAAGQTDCGKVRGINEDSYLVNGQYPLFAVADGMGGHGAGDIASQLALQTLNQCFEETLQNYANDGEPHSILTIEQQQLEQWVSECVNLSNTRIYDKNLSTGNTHGTGMGTTLVGLVLYREPNTETTHALLFNVGDSRAYSHTASQLTQLTVDHTLYEEWRQSGELGPAPPRNIITRALGLYAEVDIDMQSIQLSKQSTYWLCSDGLSGMLSNADLKHITDTLYSEQSPENSSLEAVCERLISESNAAGGHDNITVVAVQPLAIE